MNVQCCLLQLENHANLVNFKRAEIDANFVNLYFDEVRF